MIGMTFCLIGTLQDSSTSSRNHLKPNTETMTELIPIGAQHHKLTYLRRRPHMFTNARAHIKVTNAH